MTSGRSHMLATRKISETGIQKYVLKTTMDCHSELVLHSLRNNQPVQVVMHQIRHGKGKGGFV